MERSWFSVHAREATARLSQPNAALLVVVYLIEMHCLARVHEKRMRHSVTPRTTRFSPAPWDAYLSDFAAVPAILSNLGCSHALAKRRQLSRAAFRRP